MVNRDTSEVRGWIQLGAFLLVQTAVVAAFIMQVSTDVSSLKLRDAENRSEHAAIRSDLRTLDVVGYKLERIESQLTGLQGDLKQHSGATRQ